MDDEQRLRELFSRHADAVHQYAAQRVGHAEAGEVVSDTFLVAWRKPDRVPAGAERAWLLGVARRETLSRLRTAGRRTALYERLLRQGTEPGRDIADGVVAGTEVRQALRAVSDADRDILLTTFWTDLTPAEVAKVLGCSRATYAVRLHRARRRFGAALGIEHSGTGPTTLLRSVS